MSKGTTRVDARSAAADAAGRATGRDREEWFRVLDAWGAAQRPHRDIARWLMGEHRLTEWWAQTLTVWYEQTRGLRPVGGDRDGRFSVSTTKTFAVSVERLFEAFTDERTRARWLPNARISERTSQPGRSARFDWNAGQSRIVVGFAAKGPARSQVSLLHERLPSASASADARSYWRDRLSELEVVLDAER